MFIDRKNEMNALEKEYDNKRASFVIVYGRRRTGKTSLISEFIKKHPENALYFLATTEPEHENKKAFTQLIYRLTGNELLKNSDADWLTLFRLISDYNPDKKKIVVLDEFQYLSKGNSEFPSVMQKIWDTVLCSSNVMLILCGSLTSLMKKQTLDYSSPLYGRRTCQIKLGQIPFKYYHEFFPDKSEEELIEFYSVTGGVPRYAETFKSSENIEEAIINNVLCAQSYLYEEPYFLLQNEVSEIGSYFALIKSIAFGNRKLSDIARNIGIKQTSLTKYLNVLSDLDLIEREVPITESNPAKSKMGLYKIKDNFISFWFRYVYPYRSYLERGETDYVVGEIKKTFRQNFASYIYEDICREKIWEKSASGALNFSIDKVGRYWGSLCGEIDILGFDSQKNNMIIGECKYTQSEKGLDILRSLEEKADVMKKHTGCKNVNFIIFGTSGFSKGLIEESKQRDDIMLEK